METTTERLAVRDRLAAHVHSRIEAARHAMAQENVGAAMVHVLDSLAAMAGELERLDVLASDQRTTTD